MPRIRAEERGGRSRERPFLVLTTGRNPPNHAGVARWDSAVATPGRGASMLMAELESLGANQRSDERLLSRLGWTRTRAVQVLRELEEHGMVTSSIVKAASGRPRKLYRPVDPVVEADRIGRPVAE